MKKRSRIISKFKDHSIDFDWYVSNSESHLKELSQKAATGYPFIIAIGGDTTLTLVAEEIIHSPEEPALGMIGAGSTNDIIRSIDSYNIDSLCSALKARRLRRMDVGKLEIRGKAENFYFLGTLSLGLGIEVNRFVHQYRIQHPIWKRGGNFAQTVLGIHAIRRAFVRKSVPWRIFLQADGVQKEVDFTLLVFTNIHSYANIFQFIPEASPFNRRLDGCLIQSTSLPSTLALGLRACMGQSHVNSEEIRFFSGKSFKVSSDDKLDLQYDGKVVSGVEEFKVFVVPSALKVIA